MGLIVYGIEALNGLLCADVPLRNYSLTHSLIVYGETLVGIVHRNDVDADIEIQFFLALQGSHFLENQGVSGNSV